MRDDRTAKTDSAGCGPRQRENDVIPGKVGGLAGVHKRAEELQAQRQSFGLRKFTQEFRWDGGKPASENAICIRVLGDELIVATKQHRAVPLPENKFFFGVCRHAEPIEADYCYVCDVLAKNFEGDNKQKKRNGLIPTDIAVALGVEMEAILEGPRKVFAGWKPKLVEFQIPDITDGEKDGSVTPEEKEYRKLLDGLGKPGTKVNIPNIGLLVGAIMGTQALFDIPTRRASISDRVFEIARHGKGLDTKWGWEHEGPDPEPDPSAMLAEYAAKYPFELPIEWVERTSAQTRYDFFFKLTADAPAGAESAATTADDADDTEPVSDSRSALMERLKGKGSNS